MTLSPQEQFNFEQNAIANDWTQDETDERQAKLTQTGAANLEHIDSLEAKKSDATHALGELAAQQLALDRDMTQDQVEALAAHSK